MTKKIEISKQKEPYANIHPLHSDFTLYCCGSRTTYDSSVDHTLEDEGGILHCRICGKSYEPDIKITLKKVQVEGNKLKCCPNCGKTSMIEDEAAGMVNCSCGYKTDTYEAMKQRLKTINASDEMTEWKTRTQWGSDGRSYDQVDTAEADKVVKELKMKLTAVKEDIRKVSIEWLKRDWPISELEIALTEKAANCSCYATDAAKEYIAELAQEKHDYIMASSEQVHDLQVKLAKDEKKRHTVEELYNAALKDIAKLVKERNLLECKLQNKERQ